MLFTGLRSPPGVGGPGGCFWGDHHGKEIGGAVGGCCSKGELQEGCYAEGAMLRERMMQHRATLLRLYQSVSVAEGQMEEERGEADGDDHDQYQQYVAMAVALWEKGSLF